MASNSVIKVSGINVVIRNANRLDKNTAMRAARGLKTGAVHIQRKSLAIVPVWRGELKGAWGIIPVGGTGFNTVLRIGYEGKEYAVYAHEIPPDSGGRHGTGNKHGASFNKKHAARIAAAKEAFKGTGKKDRYYFNRGVNQQYKFLETPLRTERTEVIRIVQRAARVRP